MTLAPTPTTYNAFQRAYDHFNAELFEGRLPPCLITLRGADGHCRIWEREDFAGQLLSTPAE